MLDDHLEVDIELRVGGTYRTIVLVKLVEESSERNAECMSSMKLWRSE